MITSKEFRAWQASVDVAGRPARGIEVARLLGRTEVSVSRYRSDGVGSDQERIIRLAMAAVSAGLKPWGTA